MRELLLKMPAHDLARLDLSSVTMGSNLKIALKCRTLQGDFFSSKIEQFSSTKS